MKSFRVILIDLAGRKEIINQRRESNRGRNPEIRFGIFAAPANPTNQPSQLLLSVIAPGFFPHLPQWFLRTLALAVQIRDNSRQTKPRLFAGLRFKPLNQDIEISRLARRISDLL
jgi:hypothetical protein